MIMISKISLHRRRQLSDAGAARQPRVKRPKFDLVTESDEEIFATDQNDLYQSDNESYNRTWYWNNSSEDGMSDSDEVEGDNPGYSSESESDVGTTVHKTLITTQPGSTTQSSLIQWSIGVNNSLRGAWGAGSKSKKERQARNAKEFQEQSYSLTAMMKKRRAVAARRAQEKAEAEKLSINESDEVGLTSNIPVPAAYAPFLSQTQAFNNFRVDGS